jgi:dihydropyrimidinase
MLDLAQADLVAAGRTDPRHYAGSRPALAEVEATRRVIDYAELVDAEVYIVHMSCSGAANAVRAARRRGLRVWGETRPIYLGLTDEAYAKGGVEAAKVCGAPPLRTDTDLTALWDALRAGDIQTIGSDNTSWTVKQKAEGATDFRKIPYGVPGLETEMRVVYSEGVAKGRLSLQGFVSAFATTPAKLFGLYPRKGTIAVGSDADLLVLDPTATQTIDERALHSRAGYDPFHGFEVRGVPRLTLSRGEVIARDGQLLSRPGRGQLVLRERKPG